MFVGRVGLFSLFMAFVNQPPRKNVILPEGKLIIGWWITGKSAAAWHLVSMIDHFQKENSPASKENNSSKGESFLGSRAVPFFRGTCPKSSVYATGKSGFSLYRTGKKWYYKPITGCIAPFCVCTLSDRFEMVPHGGNENRSGRSLLFYFSVKGGNTYHGSKIQEEYGW